MDVHVRDLRYFVVVAEELHFTRAAEQLYISQTALSKQIRVLERTLGVPLFDRTGRDVALTAAGHALLPQARQLLADWDTALGSVDQVKHAYSSAITIGMSTSPGRGGLLSAIGSRFGNQHPAATTTLRQIAWDDPTAGWPMGLATSPSSGFRSRTHVGTAGSYYLKSHAWLPCQSGTYWRAASRSSSANWSTNPFLLSPKALARYATSGSVFGSATAGLPELAARSPAPMRPTSL
jgi:hypothetical protein